MLRVIRASLKLLIPPVPREVRDEFAVLSYEKLRGQVPFLYLVVLMIIGSAAFASLGDLSLVLQAGVPAVLAALCLYRLLVWMRRMNRKVSVEQARKLARRSGIIAPCIMAFASLWCLLAWSETAAEHRSFVPLFLIIAAFSTSVCFASLLPALVSLTVALAPITIALALTGEQLNLALAAAATAGGLLIGRILLNQNRLLITSLVLQKRAETLANTDQLTGLPNRRAFFALAERHIAAGSLAGIALLDLDDFKLVNDRHGHLVGDEFLGAIASRLAKSADSQIIVSRLGGDEFALLMTGNLSEAAVAAHCTGLLAALAMPCEIEGLQLRVSGSIGLACHPGDGTELKTLLASADRALYNAKEGKVAPLPARRTRAA